MIGTVVGFRSTPYDFEKNDKKVKGVSYKISLTCDYPLDKEKDVTGDGEMCDIFKCSKVMIDSVQVGDVVSVDIDYPDGIGTTGRIKSAMLQVPVDDKFYFVPIF